MSEENQAIEKRQPGRKLEVIDFKVIGVELSSDRTNWGSPDELFSSQGFNERGNITAALAHLIDLLATGEDIYLRLKYCDVFSNGSKSLPKSGGVYQLQLVKMEEKAV